MQDSRQGDVTHTSKARACSIIIPDIPATSFRSFYKLLNFDVQVWKNTKNKNITLVWLKYNFVK